jgi:hypothetical protein
VLSIPTNKDRSRLRAIYPYSLETPGYPTGQLLKNIRISMYSRIGVDHQIDQRQSCSCIQF